MRLLHLAPASREKGIRRAGLVGAKAALSAGKTAIPRAVFVMPVVADFWTTFQWLRELRRGHDERLVAVTIRIPDDEPVYVGRYSGPHALVSVVEAARWVLAHPDGAEVIVPRSVRPREIVHVRAVSQLVGWTRAPEPANRWACVCPACLARGSRDFMRRVRGAFAKGMLAARRATDPDELTGALGDLAIPLERARGRIAPTPLLGYARSPSPSVRRQIAHLLGHFTFAQARDPVVRLLADDEWEVRLEAAEALWRAAGTVRAAKLMLNAPEDAARRLRRVSRPRAESRNGRGRARHLRRRGAPARRRRGRTRRGRYTCRCHRSGRGLACATLRACRTFAAWDRRAFDPMTVG